jgi:hypothetical protein
VRAWGTQGTKTEKGSHAAEKNQWQPNLTDAQTPYLPQKDEFWPEIKVNNEESFIPAQQKKREYHQQEREKKIAGGRNHGMKNLDLTDTNKTSDLREHRDKMNNTNKWR